MELVMEVFKSMGGTIIPPERPNKVHPNWVGPPPTGIKRYENPKWAEMIQTRIFPFRSDIDWVEYVEFCESGGGDEWFHEE